MKDVKLIFKSYEEIYRGTVASVGKLSSPMDEAIFLAVEAKDLFEYVKSFNDSLGDAPRYVDFPYDNICLTIFVKGKADDILFYFSDTEHNYCYSSSYTASDTRSIIAAALDHMNAKTTLIGQKTYTLFKGSGREKIVPITYIRSTTKQYANDEVTRDRGIVWSHSWNVIGHWRRIEGKGKDRNGLYNQDNRTWVLPCVKGAGELITKIKYLRR